MYNRENGVSGRRNTAPEHLTCAEYGVQLVEASPNSRDNTW